MNEQVATSKRNLKPFWILLAVSGLPYLLSWIYFANMDSLPKVATSNRGELIEPVRPIEGLSLQLLDNSVLTTGSLKGNWALLSAGPSECGEACLKNIFFMRQVRRLMGEERTRIKRIFVLTDAEQTDAFVKKVEPYGAMDVITGSSADKSALIEKMTVDGVDPVNRIFIVDPMTNLMMVYNPDVNPEDIAKDFRRLLKVVRIGKPKTAG